MTVATAWLRLAQDTEAIARIRVGIETFKLLDVASAGSGETQS